MVEQDPEQDPLYELQVKIERCLYDPAKYVDRQNPDSKSNRERLDSWKVRAIMSIFRGAGVRKINGTEYVIAWTERSSDE